MGFIELLLIAVGVSMDAFAVSICKGLSTRKVRPSDAMSAGLWFGGFQALMPVLGFYLGVSFADFVADVDHWIAFVLLGIIGAKMIKESFEHDDCCGCEAFELKIKELLVLALATSIDAMVTGVSFLDKPLPELLVAVTISPFFTSIGPDARTVCQSFVTSSY